MVSKIRTLSEEFFQQTVELRRQIHKNPELGFEEHETAKLIATTLKSLGWQVKEGVAKTGVVGLLTGEHPGLTIAIRADMDALPIEEQTNLSFASENPGKMHACGHDAQPHLCIDAIAAAAQVINSLQHIVSRRVNPMDPVVLTIGKINGGVRGNVIAEDVVMEGTLRTLNEQTRTQSKLWIKEQVESVCQPLGVKAEVEFLVSYDVLLSDEEATNWLIDSAEKTIGQENVLRSLEPSMGGEDFSFFLNLVQGAHFRLGIKGSREQFPIHHNRFDIDEEALKTGVQVLSQGVWDSLERRFNNG